MQREIAASTKIVILKPYFSLLFAASKNQFVSINIISRICYFLHSVVVKMGLEILKLHKFFYVCWEIPQPSKSGLRSPWDANREKSESWGCFSYLRQVALFGVQDYSLLASVFLEDTLGFCFFVVHIGCILIPSVELNVCVCGLDDSVFSEVLYNSPAFSFCDPLETLIETCTCFWKLGVYL